MSVEWENYGKANGIYLFKIPHFKALYSGVQEGGMAYLRWYNKFNNKKSSILELKKKTPQIFSLSLKKWLIVLIVKLGCFDL